MESIEAGKCYNDGSHFIAICPTHAPSNRKKNERSDRVVEYDENEEKEDINEPEKETSKTAFNEANSSDISADDKENKEDDKKPKKGVKIGIKELFNKLYKEYANLKKKERRSAIFNKLKQYFKEEKSCWEFIYRNEERITRNRIVRNTRTYRKLNLQNYIEPFNYFVTFTYDDEITNEASFKKKLSRYLWNKVNRDGWKYIGVWENGEKGRLHFHAIMVIPKDTLKGEMETVKDFSTVRHRMQTINQNTKIRKKFGRNDFEEINSYEDINNSLKYLLKYVEKSGGRLIYSRNLPTYFRSDILEQDIICNYGDKENKFILSDRFNCFDEGCLMGEVSPDVINQMPKIN